MKVPAVQHPVNMHSAKLQVINHFLSPNQDRIPVSAVHIIQLMYVRCRPSRLQMSSSNSHSLFHCNLLQSEGLRQSCLSQKRKYFKKNFTFPQSLSVMSHLILPLSKRYSQTTKLIGQLMGWEE